MPDDARVFRDANGIVRREDGSVVEDYLADTILWTGQEPSFEDIQAAKQQLNDLQAQLDTANLSYGQWGVFEAIFVHLVLPLNFDLFHSASASEQVIQPSLKITTSSGLG